MISQWHIAYSIARNPTTIAFGYKDFLGDVQLLRKRLSVFILGLNIWNVQDYAFVVRGWLAVQDAEERRDAATRQR